MHAGGGVVWCGRGAHSPSRGGDLGQRGGGGGGGRGGGWRGRGGGGWRGRGRGGGGGGSGGGGSQSVRRIPGVPLGNSQAGGRHDPSGR